MWSNISAPKSGLKVAQVGHQLKLPKQVIDKQRENSGGNSNSNTASNTTNEHDENNAEQDEQNGDWTSPGGERANRGAPLMRYKHAVCASTSSGFIYIHGGRFANGVPLNDDVWRFDPHENSWLQLRTSGCKPPSLQEHSIVEHQDQLYMFGGQVSAASGQENSFWRLDLTRGVWHSLDLRSSMKLGAYLGPSNRRGHSACIYRDSMYIFGGYEDFRGSTNQLWQYDLLNERWELRNLSSSSACHPEARHSHSAIVYQDSMFIYGGLSNLKPLGDLWRWSWRDKRWFKERTRGHSPGALHGHSAIQAFGSMFVFGGERASGRTTRSLWRLNLSNMCWQKIKTKGPRPGPTTWHVAIANPMGILDQANYLIEGESSDLEAEPPPLPPLTHHQDELVLLVNNQQSASDNCFSSSSPSRATCPEASSRARAGLANSKGAKQETIPMKTFRPIDNQQQVMARLSQRATISHSKSSIEQIGGARGEKSAAAAAAAKGPKAKRRLRLSFLRRTKKSTTSAGTKGRAQIPTSWSAANILGGGPSCVSRSSSGSLQAPNPKKRHSVTLADPIKLERVVDAEPAPPLGGSQNEIEMQDAPGNHVGILDNLDSDIKEMFERAMSPAGSNDDHDDDEPDGQRRGSFELAAGEGQPDARMARDSMTQSQLSSWLAASTTQTYQTARELLTSQSTMTITPSLNELPGAGTVAAEQQVVSHQQPRVSSVGAAATRLADVRQRRSMQHFSQAATRRSEGNSEARADRPARAGRPKSEILQSLIDRADARIKHLYTPYFHLDQAHNRGPHESALGGPGRRQAKFNSNDPLLGALANHRMFRRSEAGEGQPGERATRRAALDKSKRHTIHQTMTHYNLYFAEGAESNHAEGQQHRNGTANQLRRQPVSSDLTQSPSTSSTTTTTTTTATCRGKSTSAALVGVRDGTTTNSSSGGAADSQRTGANQSEVTSLGLASSESRTLCDVMDEEGAGQGPERDELEGYEANGEVEMQYDEEDEHDGGRDNLSEQSSGANNTQNNGGDNTSLSFSVIAEFEEDDMLQQYSSPTEPKIDPREVSRAERQYEDHEDELDDDDYYEEEEQQQQHEALMQRRAYEHRSTSMDVDHQQPAPATCEPKQLAGPQKSTSSGYDSIRSLASNQANSSPARPDKKLDEQRVHQHSYEAGSTSSSVRTGSSPGGCRETSEQAANKQHPSQRTSNLASTTNDSLTTSESLPLTPPSKSLPASPPDLSSRSAGKSSFASSLMSGPSRLFGKKKTKTRYWQLCMFVLGGKQQNGSHGNLNEPISIWRLYI